MNPKHFSNLQLLSDAFGNLGLECDIQCTTALKGSIGFQIEI